MPTAGLPTKPCVTCGRVITWRKKWERDWDNVKHCSDRCKRIKLDDLDARLELVILRQLADLPRGKTICPSEASRAVATDWQPLMDRTRMAARRLVDQGQIVITQGGKVVDPSTAKGPIRLRKA